MSAKDARGTPEGSARLGTFAGVFTPSVLTILGLILFRRTGYVVGGAGLASALGILALAHVVSVLTSSSLSAIATNLRVKGGGDYYLISRSLGVEFGGALGLVLFAAQATSVAFYCIGFGEAVAMLLPPAWGVPAWALALGAVVVLFAFAWAGADWATRLQYVVMTALGAGLISFFVGGFAAFDAELLAANWSSSALSGEAGSFWVLFALFFPAVTGFTQGVSMSGDLEDPGRSLPAGTFAAVLVSLVTYGAAIVVFAAGLPADELVADYEAMNRIAWFPGLIVAGIVAATLSSALASFMGAPRILQAVAADRIFPALTPFAVGAGPTANPRRGVLATLAVALGVVALGGVDVIAPVVSMFFLISYGLLNYATALEARAASPSFRPRFRWFHYRTSLAGALVCLGLMVMISPGASAASLAVLFALYQYVQRIAGPGRWADSKRDHHFHQVRQGLLAMGNQPSHPRSWRPHLLVFSDQPARRRTLVSFAQWLEGGAGVTTVVRILEGSGPDLGEQAAEAEQELAADLAARGLEAFTLVVAAPDLEAGAQTVIQSHGLGPVRTNTVLLNWLDDDPDESEELHAWDERLFVRNLRACVAMGVNVVVLHASEGDLDHQRETPAASRRIDVWWSDESTGQLMLLMAYLMTRTLDWEDARLRVLVPAARSREEKERAAVLAVLDDVRIDAEVLVLREPDRARLVAEARDSSLVLLPLRLRQHRVLDPFRQRAESLLDDLPMCALVAAAEDIDLDAEPEEGEPGRIAALSDAAEAARKEVADVERSLARARELADTTRASAESLAEAPDDGDDEQTRKAERRAAAAARRLRTVERAAVRIRSEAAAIEQELATLAGTSPAAGSTDGRPDSPGDSSTDSPGDSPTDGPNG